LCHQFGKDSSTIICISCYIPNEHITVEEQLFPTKEAWYPFTQYMGNQPAKITWH